MNRKVFICIAALIGAAPAAAEDLVQGLLLRAVTVTCKLDATIAFYHDILGQKVVEESVRDGARMSAYVDLPATSQVRLIAMAGSGAYPGGDIAGGKLAFIGIADQTAAACQKVSDKPARAGAGDVVFSMRVAHLDEVARRAASRGVPILVPPGKSGSGLARNMMMVDPNGRIVEAFEISFAKLPE